MCVCVCVIFFASAAKMWAYGGRLKDDMSLHLQSVYLSIQAGGGLFFYGTILYMSLSQLRLLVSESSAMQNIYENRQYPPIPWKKRKKKNLEKKSVLKRWNRYFPSLYSVLIHLIYVLVTPVK